MGRTDLLGGRIVFWGEILDMLSGAVGDAGDGKRTVGRKGDHGCGHQPVVNAKGADESYADITS